MKRMTLDRILPQFLLKENARGSSPRILILFYALCVSVLLITNGKIGAMAGVYTISFLTVMAYFALGNFLLKIKRSRLPRPESAKPFVVALALLLVIIALYGNIKLQSDLLVVFLQYFVPAIVIIQILLKRNIILEYLVVVVTSFLQSVNDLARFTRLRLSRTLRSLTQQEFVYFTKGDDVASLNRVMMYVEENEITKRLKVVSVKKPGEHVPQELINDVKVLDRAYPDLSIEFIEIEGDFGPELVEQLSSSWSIPANFMFIGSPGDKFPYRVAELGGVRLII
jgi:hypothetical protein